MLWKKTENRFPITQKTLEQKDQSNMAVLLRKGRKLTKKKAKQQ
jgi:hypothetical protein